MNGVKPSQLKRRAHDPEKSAKKKKKMPKEENESPWAGVSQQQIFYPDLPPEPKSTCERMVDYVKFFRDHVILTRLAHSLKNRYVDLLEKASASEADADFSQLEERYGHLVENPFWFDRLIKLGTKFRETKPEEYVWNKSMDELEKEVGHLVPFTEDEKEFKVLYEKYDKAHWKIDGKVTLEFLRMHFGKKNQQEDESPYSPSDEKMKLEEISSDEDRCVNDFCPIHEESAINCLNPDDEFNPFFFKCTHEGCPVFYTSDTERAVRGEITNHIHRDTWHLLRDGSVLCDCGCKPRMKLSQSKKNFNRVFLTCFKKNDPCGYFQFLHWKPRKQTGPMDKYVVKQHAQPIDNFGLDKFKYEKKQPVQQLTSVGLDRFKKDTVFVGRGFVPSADYKSEFVNGVNRSSSPTRRAASDDDTPWRSPVRKMEQRARSDQLPRGRIYYSRPRYSF